MGDKKKRKNKKLFNFAPTKNPKEIAAYLANLLKQNNVTMDTGLDSTSNVSHKRELRAALNNQDIPKLKNLLGEGFTINLVIDDVFWDTPLTFAVKHSYLEIVELLVTSAGCDVNYHDRNKYTPLDEAIRAWFTSGSITPAKQHRARRFRVLRCLLSFGAKELTKSLLDNLIYLNQNTRSGVTAIDKLVKVICQKGHVKVKTVLFTALVPYSKMSSLLKILLLSGADATYLINQPPSCLNIPEDNAIILIKAINHRTIHRLVEQRLSVPRETRGRDIMPRQAGQHRRQSDGTPRYYEPLRLLVLSGHQICLQTMSYLYKHHATLYKKSINSVHEPRPLKDMARLTVRKHLKPNVYHAVSRMVSIPEQVKPFLLFEDK